MQILTDGKLLKRVKSQIQYKLNLISNITICYRIMNNESEDTLDDILCSFPYQIK